MRRGIAVLVLSSIATAGPLMACPIEKIVQATLEPLGRHKKIEVSAREVRSLEGAVWHVYHRRDGALHSIVRTDFGESGQRQTRASFLDRRTFGIVVTILKYDAPIGAKAQVQVAERSSTEFFFCDGSNIVYLPANPQEEANALAAIRRAKDERRMLFSAEEIAPYLNSVR